MQSPPFPRYLFPPRSKYSPQHHVLKHPQLPFLPQCQRPSFSPIQNNRPWIAFTFFKGMNRNSRTLGCKRRHRVLLNKIGSVRICNTEKRSRNHCCRVQAISIKTSEWVTEALVIQHIKRMLRIIFSCMACLAVPYLFTLSHKRCDFRKKNTIDNKKPVLIFFYNSCPKHFWTQEKLSQILL